MTRRVALLLAAVLLSLLCLPTVTAAQPAPPSPPDPQSKDELCKRAPWLTALCAQPPPPDPTKPAPEPLPGPLDINNWPQRHATGMGGLFDIADGHDGTLQTYDLFGYSPGILINPMPTVWLALGNLCFSLGKHALGFAVWFTEWVLSDIMIKWVRTIAEDLEKLWTSELIGRLRLRQVVLILAVLYLGWIFLRGYTRRAWTELFSTLIINALSITVLTHPVAFLVGENGVLALTREIGADASSVMAGQPSTASRNLAFPLTQSMIDNLLIAPWETLNFGEPITSATGEKANNHCKAMIDRVRRDGPWSSKNEAIARDWMGECNKKYSDYNSSVGPDRMFGAFAYMIAMILFAILTVALNSIQIFAPYLMLFEGLMLVAVLIIALLPRWQHHLYNRISSIAAVMGAVLAGMLFLAIMITMIRTLMQLDLGPQLVRFAVIDLTVFSGFVFRKRLAAGLQKMRTNLHRGLQRASTRGRAPQALPRPTVAGGNRLSRLVTEHGQAFKSTVAPVGQLKSRMVTAVGHLGKAGGTVGKAAKTAAAYTVGAPVSLPRAATRARTVATTKARRLRASLARKAAGASRYVGTYTGNVGKAAGVVGRVTGARAVGRVVVAGANTALSGLLTRPGTDLADPIGDRIRTLTPTDGTRVPEMINPEPSVDKHPAFIEPDPRDSTPVWKATARRTAPTPTPAAALPPGMLPNPPTFISKLKDKLHNTSGKPS